MARTIRALWLSSAAQIHMTEPLTVQGPPVSMVTPLEIPIGRDVLIAVLEDVINNLLHHRTYLADPDDVLETDVMIAQRRAFLVWLRGQSGINVPVALYPVSVGKPQLMS